MIEFEISTNKKQIEFDITQGIPKYVPANFQSKTVIPTTEQQVVRADKPYDGLEQVTVEPIKVLDKTITQNGAYSANEENIDGYSSVFVNVQPNLQEKTITITENGTTEVVADSGYDGLAKVSVEANVKNNSLLNVIKGMNSYDTTNYPFELTADMFDENSVRLRQGFLRENLNLTKVVFPETLKITGQYSFHSCKNLKSVDVSHIESLEANTFSNCTSLTKIDLPNATYVNFDAFRGCTELEEVNMPNAGLGRGKTFYNCTKLKSLIFSKEKTTTIGDSEFYYCVNLTSIDLPNVTAISSNAFNGCSRLENIYLSDNVSSIGNYAFMSCRLLTHINKFPKITSLGYNVFSGCYKLTKISIPNVNTINSAAFYNCTSLSVVDFRGRTNITKVPTVQSNSFTSVPTTCKFIIPDELYDSWIASTNWVSLYNKGYQFIKASEYTET